MPRLQRVRDPHRHLGRSVEPVAVASAVVDNPACAGCDQAMDPLASHFFAPTHTLNATASLVIRRAAQLAAAAVVDHDAVAPAAERRLFTQTDVDDPTRLRPQLAELHARIYGELVAPDDPALDDAAALFTDALAASGSPRRAWTLTLTGMLSDLRAIYY